jgi:hypothetical protein
MHVRRSSLNSILFLIDLYTTLQSDGQSVVKTIYKIFHKNGVHWGPICSMQIKR